SDVNEAWGFGPEIPSEILAAANLSPILRFLMKEPKPGLKTKDELVAACRSIRERAGEACAPLYRIDPATLPDRVDRYLAATGCPMRRLPLYVEDPRAAVEAEPPLHLDRHCTRCALHEGARSVCLSAEGEPGGLFVVGEGPGRDEDAAGRPFVGASGK